MKSSGFKNDGLSRSQSLFAEGGEMNRNNTISQYKEKLLEQRQEILGRLQRLEASWQTLGERDIELEEEAQKADITELFTHLDELEQERLEEIELALNKFVDGRYGVCERCRKMISPKRLEALPTARLCRKCAAAADSQGQ